MDDGERGKRIAVADMSSEEARLHAEGIVDSIREALIVLNDSLRVVSANSAFHRQFRVAPEETEERLIYDLGNRQWDVPELRHLLETIIPRQTSFDDFEVRHRFQQIGEKVMVLNARRVERETGKPGLVLLAIEDITERSVMRRRLEESEARYRKLVEEINSIIIAFDRRGMISFFNRFSEKLFGYHRDEMVAKPLVGTVVPEVDSRGTDNSRIIEHVIAEPEKYYSKR